MGFMLLHGRTPRCALSKNVTTFERCASDVASFASSGSSTMMMSAPCPVKPALTDDARTPPPRDVSNFRLTDLHGRPRTILG
jgi:hypothetical protein